MNSTVKGFTLIDLLIVLAIMGVLLSIGVPSFNSFIVNTRLINYSNEMVRALNLARSEAAKQNYRVTVCKSSTTTASTPACNNSRAWEDGLIVFVDKNNNQVLNAGEKVILGLHALKSGFFYQSSYANYISYRPDGRSHINGNFRICSPDSDFPRFSKVVISDTGRISTQNDSNTNYGNETYTSACE